MDEDQPDLFPEHRPPPHHHVSWDDVWGASPDPIAPEPGSNALVVRPEAGESSDRDLEVSLPAPTFDAPPPEPADEEEEILPPNLFGASEDPEEEPVSPEAMESPAFMPTPIDLFAEKPEATFRQFLGGEVQDQAAPERRGPGDVLPDVWTFSSGRRAGGGRRGR